MSVAIPKTRTVEQERAEASPTNPRRRSADWVLRRLLCAGDAIAVLIALGVAADLPGSWGEPHRPLWGLVAVPVMIVLFKLYGLYDRDVKRISQTTVDELPWVFHAALVGSLLLWLYSRYSPLHRLDFGEMLVFGGLLVTVVLAVRSLVRDVFARVAGAEPALLVGGGVMAEVLIGKLTAHPKYRLDVIGVLANDRPPSGVDSLPVLGRTDELADVAECHRVTRVIVSPVDIDDLELEAVVRHCRALALKVSVLPRLSDVLGPAVEIDDVEGVTVLGVNPPALPRSSRALKRALDVLLAVTVLVLAAPLMALAAILIKLDSPGPVFFAQERVGKGGRRFRLFKLRTMVLDAEQLRGKLLEQSTDPQWLMLEHDPRITAVGRHLRRLSIDELPQFWNVLRGEMSIVGPRPLIPAEDERVEGWARDRLDLTPGITGYWQVLGRTRIPFDEMVKLDYLYVTNWSLWGDLRLMLRTLPTVLGGRGVN